MSNSNAVSMAGISFPSRLYMFLGVVEDTSIASWQPHGRCFRIHRPKEFVKLANPSWFKYTKYSSFQRQLNIYGFHRIQKGADKNCYYHKHFLRGHPQLLDKIERIPLKKEHATGLLCSNPPDFYLMTPLPELGLTRSDKRIGQQEKVHTSDICTRSAMGVFMELSGRNTEDPFIQNVQVSNAIRNDTLLAQFKLQRTCRPSRDHVPLSAQLMQRWNNMESPSIHPAPLAHTRSAVFVPGNGNHFATTPQPSMRQILLDSMHPTLVDCNRYNNFQTGNVTLQMLQLKAQEKISPVVSPMLLSSTPRTNLLLINSLH